MATRCEHRKHDGSQCQAPARRGMTKCFLHDEGSRTAAQQARAAGGKKVMAGRGEPVEVRLENERDAIGLARVCIARMLNGQMEPPQAHAVAALCNMALKAMGQDETDKRLEELENRLRPLKGMSPAQLSALVEAEGASSRGH